MTLLVALLLAVAFIGGVLLTVEGVARAKVAEAVQRRCHEVTGLPTTMSFGSKSIVWQSLSRSISAVEIVTQTVPGDVAVSVRIVGITGDDSASRMEAVSCRGYLPYRRIVEFVSERELFGSSPHRLTGIRGSARDGSVRVDIVARTPVLSVPMTVTVRPELNDSGLHFAVTRVQTLVFGLPTQFAQAIVDDIGKTLRTAVERYAAIEQISVGDDGVDFSASGEQVVIAANLTRPTLRLPAIRELVRS
ncbi:hypothetical protein GOEFS_035_00140 [Gordonia effusa NBRC 100432]|uniref:DUF2993 domain-containing protein n=1 Tax=Gordonia effusa NBRC 100432 TaxID=1077974 RepID=H0QXD2_9ACTN|nr:hypothetical protein [Gordonia effusa]GAB17483.1 hypothetical protein GOEFS_035_00140 [Gordonia effusa NBRC 100432]